MSAMCVVGWLSLGVVLPAQPARGEGAPPGPVEANHVAEVWVESARDYPNPFMDAELVAVVTPPSGAPLRIPGFWAGGRRWCFRYSSALTGRHTWRTECSDAGNQGLHGAEGWLDVVPNTDTGPLYQHGPVCIAGDHRHFAHADGKPFLWLGDTWWKNLCKRMTWEGFQELAADRAAKGFSVVQIVCGPYPDEGTFEPRWENEGGKPYETRDFSQVNPLYFDYADRRMAHLAQVGLVPAIVGGWARGDCDGMALAGVEGLKRHWRHLVARYGAYPAIWIIGGESQGPQWTEVARYVRETDPYHRPITMHPHHSGRDAVTDEAVIDFDMLQTGHGDWDAARGAIPQLKAAYSRTPPMPAMIGEFCYEQHMQTGFADQQRYVFWASMLSGAAGVTYGAAGVWHASVEGDPGLANVYDLTTWRQGMAFAGSTELGLGRRFLEGCSWEQFEPHPEWTEEGCFAAGIPGETRVIYMPRRGVYNWTGPVVKGLEEGVPYEVFYFDPVRGGRHAAGTVVNVGPLTQPFEGHSGALVLADGFADAAAATWRDYGTPTRREGGRLVGGKGMLTVVEGLTERDLMVAVEGRSDAEVGVVLRFQDPDRYLVALYSPLLKCIYLHDRQQGAWGAPLGRVEVPEIGPRVRLYAAAWGDYAAMVLSDGERTYLTPPVQVQNNDPGQVGLWMYQIGDRQEYDEFAVSRTAFAPPPGMAGGAWPCFGDYRAPNVPCPQDWVLVMQRAGRRIAPPREQ